MAKRIAKLAKNGFPLTGKKVRQTAYKYARENRIKGFSVKYEAAGYKWLHNFIQRHKKLKVKKASQISRNRASSLTQQSVLAWFREYVTGIIQKYKITDPRCIWNVDETNVTNIPKEQKFVGEKGKKLNQVVGSERAETSTVIGCTNAAGEKMPPLIIHKGVRVPAAWSRDAPQYYRVRASRKGYVNDALFHYWGRMFIAHIRRLGLDKNHIALIMDGHGSHVYNLPFVDDMYQNNISVAILESHTTHATQPMDQYPFKSFKKHYNDNLEEWCANNEGDPLPKSAFFGVFQPAWERAMTPHNIRAGFRVTGIYPINPRAIPPEKFVTSSKCQELVKVRLY